MPQLDITENFADNTILTQAQLHKAFLDIEDFLNLVKLDEENIQAGSITALSLADLSLTTAKYGVASIVLSKLAQEVIDRLNPAGLVAAYAGTTIPSGWLYCDGSAVSRTVYFALFAAIGILHGNGDASSTFNLPNYKGYFLRGQDDGANVDPDAAARTASGVSGGAGDQVGSVQSHDFYTHAHSLNDPGHTHSYTTAQFVEETHNGGGGARFAVGATTSNNGSNISMNANGGNETRPVNKYVRFIIKV